MLKPESCSLFLLLFLLTGLYLVNGNVSKRSCLGESITIMENITYTSNDIVVSIYKNGDIKFILGMWHVQDGVPVIKNGQSDRLVLDKTGNIWILNLIISDEAKYTIKIDIGNSSKKYDVTLEVMAPPTKNCKPKIIHAGNNLFAELKTDECGRPPVSAYWLENPGISISSQVLELQHGNDNGIYHACIEGDSLICAKISNFLEHCSFYNKSEPKPMVNKSVVDSSNSIKSPTAYNIPRASPESSTITISICVMVVLCFLLLSAKRIKTLYQCWKKDPDPQKDDNKHCTSSSPDPPAAVPNTSTCPGATVSGLSDLLGNEIATHSNDPEDTEMKSISEDGEVHPLIRPIEAGRSSKRRTFDKSIFEEEEGHIIDTSSPEEERSETNDKLLEQGDSVHSIAQGVPGTFNPKMSIGTLTKPTGTRQKNITPLPPEDREIKTMIC